MNNKLLEAYLLAETWFSDDLHVIEYRQIDNGGIVVVIGEGEHTDYVHTHCNTCTISINLLNLITWCWEQNRQVD